VDLNLQRKGLKSWSGRTGDVSRRAQQSPEREKSRRARASAVGAGKCETKARGGGKKMATGQRTWCLKGD